jgi:hypothetical protein
MRLLAVAVVALAAAAAVPAALADGDPASDVLLYQNVFPSYTDLPKGNVAALTKLVDQANKRGYTVRVALINGRFDLGAVPLFWLKPQPYAKFLSQELLGPAPYTDRVLVVMPNGFGISRNGYAIPAERRLLDGLPTARERGEDVAAAGFRAVKQLAALHGITLSGSLAGGGGGGHGLLIGLAGGGLVAALAVAAAVVLLLRRRRSSA